MEKKSMNSYIEQYDSKQNGVTLHTWTEREGRKEENFYITGLSGTTVAAWFREKLCTKHLPDLLDFPYSPSPLYAYRLVPGFCGRERMCAMASTAVHSDTSTETFHESNVS